jgi:hypothetical protein
VAQYSTDLTAVYQRYRQPRPPKAVRAPYVRPQRPPRELSRDALGVDLKECLMERYGSIQAACDALDMDNRTLYRAYSRHSNGRHSLAPQLKLLAKIGYRVTFTVDKISGGE